MGWRVVRPGFALSVVLVLAVGAPLVGGASSDPPEPMYVSDLYGRILPPAGWGFTAGTVSNPGPSINVSAGESVTLNLFSGDGIGHQWALDLNGNQLWDAGEPLSDFFSASTVYPFTAPGPGTYSYFCFIHGWPAQNGPFVVAPAGNAPPTVRLTNPDGVAQNRWTGGSTQRLAWTMDDPDDGAASLLVFLNYSYNGGTITGTIAAPPALPAGATSLDWTVPTIDATDFTVHATVVDPQGAEGFDDGLVPAIDSTRPRVTATVPGDGATDVDPTAPIDITFSEAMNRTATEAVVTLCELPACTGVPLTVVGWTANSLTVRPLSPLAGNASFQGNVSRLATDASSPGNAMAADHTWTFATSNAPPVGVVLAPTAAARLTGGSMQNVSWNVTDREDPTASLTVFVNYSATGAAPWTPILGPVPGDMTPNLWIVPADDTTTARLELTVLDTTGARGVALSEPFAVDSTPPSVVSTIPAGGATGVPLAANVLVEFSEPMDRNATATRSVVGLIDEGSGVWVPLTLTWDGAGVVLTADPVPILQPSTPYRLHVNGTARDASSPGLAMGTNVTARFTTAVLPDTTPPSIANVSATPPSQTAGGTVAISTYVTDDVAVAIVAVNVTMPDGTWANATMTPAGGDRWTHAAAYAQLGAHPFVVWASDTSGNWASAGGSFTITPPPDTTAPAIANVTAAPPSQTAGGTVTISADVTDDRGVASVAVNVTRPDASTVNATMAPAGGDRYASASTWSQVGTHAFVIWALDAAGNPARATGSFTITAPPDLQAPTITNVAATPPTQSPGGTVAISATVTDNVGVASVAVNVTLPSGGSTNRTMADAGGSVYAYSQAWTQLGTHAFRIWASDPSGNWASATGSFAIAAPGDRIAPTIAAVSAAPSPQTSGGTVTISARITDNVGVAGASVEVTQPDGVRVNTTMAPQAYDVWSSSRAWTQVGVHTFRIWASDDAGNWASAAGSFEITEAVDAPPTISHTRPAGPFRVGDSIRIEATVTDDRAVQEVRIDWTDVAGNRQNVTMAREGGVYAFTIPGQTAAGNVTYTIVAVDDGGQVATVGPFALAIEAPPVPPEAGLDILLVPLAVGLLAAVVVAVLATLLARRRRKEPPGEEQAPEGETTADEESE